MSKFDICALAAFMFLAGTMLGLQVPEPKPKPTPPVPAPLTEARVRAIVIYEVERAVKKREAKPLLPEVRGCQCQ